MGWEVCKTFIINLSSSFTNDGYLIHNAEFLKLSQGKKISSLGLRLEIIVTYYKALFRNTCNT